MNVAGEGILSQEKCKRFFLWDFKQYSLPNFSYFWKTCWN